MSRSNYVVSTTDVGDGRQHARRDPDVRSFTPHYVGPYRVRHNDVSHLWSTRSPLRHPSRPRLTRRAMLGQEMMGGPRYGSPDDVVPVVAIRLSKDASYFTGINAERSGGSV
jgi:NAD(P)-dependent dehydrogenase (short-subunit alcohol dehydrogenase family)